LRCAHLWKEPLPIIQHARFQPCAHQAHDRLGCMELGQQAVMRDAVEAFLDVGIQHILGLEPDVVKDGFNRIVGTAARSEPIRVGLELCFPLRFEGQLDQGLPGAVTQGRDA
jgi:hypothetical protein